MKSTQDLFRGHLVRLSAPREEDAEILSRWSEDAAYLRDLDTDYARPLSSKEFAERLESARSDASTVEFHLRTVDGDKLIGLVALHSIEWNNQTALLAIGIGEPGYRGKGYGSDALHLILRYAFDELNLYRVGLDVIRNNRRAIRAYEKVGFQQEGIVRGAVLRDGQRTNLVLMGILRDEWQERTAGEQTETEREELS